MAGIILFEPTAGVRVSAIGCYEIGVPGRGH